MKKILFVAATAILLAAGCQKTEIINGQVGNAMTFSTGMGKLTKSSGTSDADNDGMTNLKAQDFRVWASYVEADANTGAAANSFYDGMADSPVTYSETDNGVWSTDKQYYWPGTGKKLNFFAISGVEQNAATVDASNKTLTVVDFTVDNANPNLDLMVADFVQQDQSTKEVGLNFRHLLSKIEFWFKTAADSDVSVWVQEISVEGVMTKSTLTTSVTETESAFTTTSTWATPTDGKIFVDDYTKTTDDTDLPTDLVKNTSVTLTDEDNNMLLTSTAQLFTTWLVMPQTIYEADSDANLKVKIVYVMGNRQFVSEFLLGSESLTAWVKNQYIKYTIDLSPNLIKFIPSVEDWTSDGNEGDTESIKDVPMNN